MGCLKLTYDQTFPLLKVTHSDFSAKEKKINRFFISEEKSSAGKYRYSFNGMEKDDEVAGNGHSYTAEFWQYDSRLGRRWNVDPVVKSQESPYATFANNPIWFIDPSGADTSFTDNQARKDFLHTQANINTRIDNVQNKIGDIKVIAEKKEWSEKKIAKKLKTPQIALKNLNKLKSDFDYITLPTTPKITYSTDITKLAEDANGLTNAYYYEGDVNVAYATVYFRPGLYSTVVHESRHALQPNGMTIFDAEYEAHTYQQIYSASDIRKKVQLSLESQYPNPEFRPVKYGLKEAIRYNYNLE